MYKPKSAGGKHLKQLENKPKTGIYLIAGHGSDDPGIEKKIPKGCKYCTFAECGLITSSEDPRIVHVENEFMKGNKIFEKPTAVNKFLHKTHKTYKKQVKDLKKTKNSITIKNYSKKFQKIPKNYTAERARHTYSLSEYSLFAYNQSVYFINELCNDLTHIVLEGDIDKNYIRDLFDEVQFILEYSGIIKFIKEPRDSNRRIIYNVFSPEDFDFFFKLFIDYFNSANSKSYKNSINSTNSINVNKDIHELIKETIYSVNKDLTLVLKESFKYSFFPTVDMVLDFYEKNKKKIHNIFDFKYEYTNKFDITQQDLFHYLPGTYYNFICRTTINEGKTMLRRELSRINPLTRKRRLSPTSLSPIYKPLSLSPSKSKSKSKSPKTPKYKPLSLSPSKSPKRKSLSPSKSKSPKYKPLSLSP